MRDGKEGASVNYRIVLPAVAGIRKPGSIQETQNAITYKYVSNKRA